MPFLKKTKDKEFAIIGLGRFGSRLARRLEALGHRVLGIDSDPRVVKAVADEITEAAILDAMDEDALRQVDITSFQTVVVSILGNFETSALITSSLKKLGIAQVISVSNSDRHREILQRVGADRVILPEEESSYQLADELSTPGMLEALHLNQDYSLIEIKTPSGLIGKGIDEADGSNVIILLILRAGELVVNPDPTTRFQPDDILVLIGEKRRLAEFSNLQ
jgi:trk system potassium uptake protein